VNIGLDRVLKVRRDGDRDFCHGALTVTQGQDGCARRVEHDDLLRSEKDVPLAARVPLQAHPRCELWTLVGNDSHA
jgi:hypothetical protein